MTLKAVADATSSAASGITVGSSAITSGTNTRVLFDDSATLGESAGLTYVKASGTLAATVLTTTGLHTARSGTATPAAASAVAGLAMGSAAIGIYWGTGSPSTALTAPKGSLYLRTDGSGIADRAYINTDGSTAWTNLVTAG